MIVNSPELELPILTVDLVTQPEKFSEMMSESPETLLVLAEAITQLLLNKNDGITNMYFSSRDECLSILYSLLLKFYDYHLEHVAVTATVERMKDFDSRKGILALRELIKESLIEQYKKANFKTEEEESDDKYLDKCSHLYKKSDGIGSDLYFCRFLRNPDFSNLYFEDLKETCKDCAGCHIEYDLLNNKEK